MSLTRILQTARKLGTPVIVTDREGEAAQVIMPFDDFAALVGEASSPSIHAPDFAKSAPMERSTYQETPSAAVSAGFLDPFTMERPSEERSNVSLPGEGGQESAPDQSSTDFLEERFFLEPLEDEEALR
ncbi:MAG: hypothetical protein RL141_82 [Candidatus Parcubacteria bacterium]|jgi:hypothetical protein